MNVREKLVELLNRFQYCGRTSVMNGMKVIPNEEVADHIIANGVTVQELDGCEYCKEDCEGYRKMFGAFSITNPLHGKEWFIDTGHCKPRQIYFCPMCGREFQKKG